MRWTEGQGKTSISLPLAGMKTQRNARNSVLLYRIHPPSKNLIVGSNKLIHTVCTGGWKQHTHTYCLYRWLEATHSYILSVQVVGSNKLIHTVCTGGWKQHTHIYCLYRWLEATNSYMYEGM